MVAKQHILQCEYNDLLSHTHTNLQEEIVRKKNSALQVMDFELSPTNESDFQSFFKDLNISERETDNKNETNDNVNDFSQIDPPVLVVAIFLLIFVMILKAFFIVYEKFEMDPMKRGFTNQMLTSQFVWSIILSMVLIIRFTLTLFSVGLKPGSLAVGLDWLITTLSIAISLNMLEATVFEYWCKLILKRVPEHDVDFIASGLMIVNFVLSFYLGILHIVGKHAEEQPLKIPGTILVILLMICLITVIHKTVNWFKTPKSFLPNLQFLIQAQENAITQEQRKGNEPSVSFVAPKNPEEEGSVSIVDQENERISSPKIQPAEVPQILSADAQILPTASTSQGCLPPFVKLNNQRFNPDLLTNQLINKSVVFASILLMLIIFFKLSSEDGFTSFRKNYLGLICYILLCFYHPFFLIAFNTKIRNFIFGHFKN